MTGHQSVVDIFKQIAGNQFGFFSRLKSVADLLESEVPTVSCEDTFGQLIGRSDPRVIGTRGVIDPDDGDLIGVLKQSTILRCCPRFLNTLAEKNEDEEFINTNISNLVTRPVPVVSPSANLLEVLDTFLNQDCDCLFVYDDPKEVLGVVTPVDFAKTMVVYNEIYSQVKPLNRLRLIDLDDMQLDEIFYRGAQTSRDIMRSIPVIDGQESVLSALKAMHDNAVTEIGLLNNKQIVTRVLTLDDILAGLRPPEDLRGLIETPQDAEGQPIPVTKLELAPWLQMCESKDPVLYESANTIAAPKTTELPPTSRLNDVLTVLIRQPLDHVILVKDGTDFVGAITNREILRIFKTIMKIQSIAY